MSEHDELRIHQDQLTEAWRNTLPSHLKEADRASVLADESESDALRITIETAGHQQYSFDFKVEYKDSREVSVSLVDVEKDGRSIDERTDIIQQLVQDYTRHIHECAQTLHAITTA